MTCFGYFTQQTVRQHHAEFTIFNSRSYVIAAVHSAMDHELLFACGGSLLCSQSDGLTCRERYEQARSFVLPGRLMFLRPLKPKSRVKATRRRYDAVWARAEDLHGEGILVSPRMMADHMPDHVTKILGKLARARWRRNSALAETVGPAVGMGVADVSGPARSQLAIDVDTESEDEEMYGDSHSTDDTLVSIRRVGSRRTSG